jgi:hypothetical protein
VTVLVTIRCKAVRALATPRAVVDRRILLPERAEGMLVTISCKRLARPAARWARQVRPTTGDVATASRTGWRS